MSATLKTLIDQTADYVKVDLDDEEDADIIQARIVSALNEAKNIIAAKLYPLYQTENITLDDYSAFAVTATTKDFYRLVEVKYDDKKVETEQYASTVYCTAPKKAEVSVKYQYIPDDMIDETDAFPFPDVVDYHIPCFRAAETYCEIKGTTSSLNKATVWNGRWKEALKRTANSDDTKEIKNIYDEYDFRW